MECPASSSWLVKGLLIGTAICSLATLSRGYGPSVSNVAAVEAYDCVAVTYDLDSDGPVFVYLMGSADGGKTFDLQMEHVSGDVGPSVYAGKGKRILWSARKDFPDGLDEIDLTLDVVAVQAPPRPQESPKVIAPVRTLAQYLESVREEIEETERLVEDKKAELKDLEREEERYGQKIKSLPAGSRSSGHTRRSSRDGWDHWDSEDEERDERENRRERDKLAALLESNTRQQDAVRKLLREAQKKLDDLRKEEQRARRGEQ